MSRKSRKNRSHYSNLTSRYMRRDAAAIARRRDYLESTSLPRLLPRYRMSLLPLQDFRSFRFMDTDLDVPFSTSGLPARVHAPIYPSRPVRNPGSRRISHRNAFSTLSPIIRFHQPAKAVVCLRRTRRKEVIHAKGIAGTKVRLPKPSLYSQISCK